MELINNEKALYTLFLCIGYGVVCGALFAGIAHLLPLRKHQKIRRMIRDISLSFWSALGLFLLSLSLTDGRPRFSLFFGTAIGWLSWKLIFKQPFFTAIHWLCRPIALCCHTIRSFFYSLRVIIQKK